MARTSEQNRIRSAEYYRKNHAVQLVKHREYYRTHRKSVLLWQNEFSKSVAGRFVGAKASAKQRGISFELTKEQFEELALTPCLYCSSEEKGCGSGLDRDDNSIGYVYDNCIPCCGSCNRVKSDILTTKEMIVAMKAVLKLRENNGRS